MAEEAEPNKLAKREDAPQEVIVSRARPDSIVLGSRQEVSLAGLSEQVKDQLRQEHAKLAIQRDDSRQKLEDDVGATRAKVTVYGQAASEMTEKGVAFTLNNSHKDSLGETKIVIGNTESAWRGIPDSRKTWITIAIIVGIVLVLVSVFRK